MTTGDPDFYQILCLALTFPGSCFTLSPSFPGTLECGNLFCRLLFRVSRLLSEKESDAKSSHSKTVARYYDLVMISSRGIIWPALLCVAALAGCRNFVEPVGKSPLKPARMSSDSVALDVFFVRFPVGDADANGPLWTEVDEMHLPAEVRQRLARNGFRVGLVGGQLPASLSKLLELKDKPAPRCQSLENQVVDLQQEPRVVRRHMELRAGVRTELIASDVQDEMPVLLCCPTGVEGESFCSAQAVLAIRVSPERDGRVRIRLVPEIHHGESRLRYVGVQGALRIQPGRAKRAFEDMTTEAVLAPGHIILVSTSLDRPSTLGYRFFTENADGHVEQKLLVLRLAQTQHDELFEPDELPLDGLVEP